MRHDLPDDKHPYLVNLGARVRNLRARRGLTRKAAASRAQVSERHWANLESGTGNASILVLLQVAKALQCGLITLLEEAPQAGALRHQHIALIGLRGAGKSTLGQRLAKELGYVFVELSRVIENLAGCSISEIHGLYGPQAYRRYERRALEDSLAQHPHAVLATPGGLVSEEATFNLLLAQCFTIWLQATPEDHMARVLAQGDTRPMASSNEAMQDLRRILSNRSPFYAKADLHFDTSLQPLEESFQALKKAWLSQTN
ncbi:MAG: helix-turn-helix domain-containing protein [Betaproteobacteria bacterium]|nr:helix-turn-helix domain-containing protein [Betaproteobacteria bacterium]